MPTLSVFAGEDGRATHYEVLGLPQNILDDQKDVVPLVKRAYHRALLRHHPDKTSTQTQGVTFSTNSTKFTIDQISTALNVLSDPRKRAEYDKSLLTRPHSGASLGDGNSGFQTDIENVDLDELPFDEAQGQWHRSCRCGNERGYVFNEEDLDVEEARNQGELLVGCLDCSLWLRVHYAVVDEDGATFEQTTATS